MLAIRRLKEYFKPKLTFRTWSFFVVSFFIIGIAFYVFRGYTKGASANWWNDSFLYRKQVNITNGNGSDLTDFQISFSLDTASLISSGKLQSDCDDIRVINIDGSPLPHWIPTSPDNATADYACDSSTTKIWTKVPTLPSGGGVIYVYYGNSSAGNSQNGNQIFELFDDFDVLNSNWSQDSGTWSADTLSGKNTVSIDPPTGASNNNYLRNTQYSNTTSLVVESSFYSVQGTETVAHPGILFYATSGFNDHRYIRPHGGGTVKAVYNGSLSIGSSVATSYTWDEWMSHTVRLNGDTSYIYENGALIATTTGLNYDGTYGNVGLVAHGGAKNHYDYVAVRKFAATEPTTSVGSEETTQGPIAYWKFDEGVGFKSQNSIKDIQGTTTNLVTNPSFENGLTGWSVANGGTWTSEQTNCVFGAYCAKGVVSSTTYALVENIGGLTVGSTVTASVYVRAESGSANFYISDSSYAGPVYGAANSTNIWKRLTATRTVPANGQINIVFYGAVSTTGYWDGVQLEVVTPSGPQVTIYCDGDQKGIGNYAWNGTAHASSSTCTYGTDGDLYGPTWQSNENCFSEKCLLFDGTDDYVSVVDSSNFTLSEYSVGLWVKPNKLPSSGKFFTLVNQWGGGGAGNASWIVYMDQSGRVIMGNHDGTTTCTVTGVSSMSTNRWSHIQTVYTGGTSGTNGLIYLNGKLDNSGTLNCTTQNSTYPLKIGHPHVAGGTTENFKGLIDEVKIYNYARSADQIKTDYAGRSAVLGLEEQDFLSDGLVGYWKMDENIGTTTNDSSGNSQIGTLATGSSAPSWSAGKYGNALTFATNTYVSLGNIGSGTEGSYGAWIKPTSHTGSVAVMGGLSSGNVSTARNVLIMREGSNCSGTQWLALFPDGQRACSGEDYNSTNFPTTQWTHVFVTFDGSYVSFYRNGQLINKVVQTGNPSGSAITTSIGQMGNSGYYFNGGIDEVRIYNRAFNSTEVAALYNWAQGPVGYWKMDENTGTSVNDSSGNSQNGTLGTGDSSPKWSSGKLGSSLTFDGESDYYSVEDSTSSPIDFTTQMSMMAWIKSNKDNSLNFSIFIEKGEPDEYEFYIRPVSGGHLAAEIGNSICDGVQVIETGQWYHAAATWDGSSVRIYVNGKLDATCARTYTMTPDDSDLTIGYNPDSGIDEWYGQIDDIKLYNYARSPKQIVEDMNGNHPAPGSPIGSAMIHYRLDEGYGTTANNVGNVGSTFNGTFGTGNSAPTWTNDGKFGKALSFDGTNDYFSIADNNSLDIGNSSSATISLWYFATNASSSWEDLISKRSAGSDAFTDYSLNLLSGTLRFVTGFNAGDPCANFSVTEPALNSWHHVVATVDSSGPQTGTKSLYVDGKRVYSCNYTVKAAANANPVLIGGDNAFRGKIDEVKIYNFVLTDDQVKVEYNQGKAIVLGAGSTGVGGTSPSRSASREYCVPGDSSTCNAPIGEWKFDEGIGSTANDTSGSGNAGTLTTGMVWAKGKIGSALDFDGVDDYVDVGDMATIDAADDLSICAWINPATDSSDDYIFAKYNLGTDTGIQFLRDNVGATSGRTDIIKIRIGQPGGNDAELETSTNSVIANQWAHVCFTFIEGSTTGLRVYINGKEDAFSPATTALVTSIDASTNTATIGSIDGSNFFDGLIDTVRIFDYVLTPAQIAWEYNQGKPVAWYRLEECQGSTAYNAVKNANGQAAGNNGTITVGATGSQTSTGTCSSGNSVHAWNNGTTGKFNGSLSFDGSDDYVSIPDQDYLDATNNFSVAGWIKLSDASGSRGFIQKHDENITNGWQIGIDSDGSPFWDPSTNSAHQNLDGTISVADGNWHYIVGTLKDTDQRLYIDGKLNNSRTYVGTPATNSIDVQLGRRRANGSPCCSLNGQIDEVKIFNYALTPEQIKTNMAGGAVRFQ